MNLDEIKNLIESDGGKFIIIENGKPVLVVTSFEDYKKNITNNSEGTLFSKKTEKVEENNKPVTNNQEVYTEDYSEENSNSSEDSEALQEQHLRIEDLPV